MIGLFRQFSHIYCAKCSHAAHIEGKGDDRPIVRCLNSACEQHDIAFEYVLPTIELKEWNP